MRLIDAEQVADAWKSAGQKHKDEAEKLMMFGNAEDFIKGAIKEACAEMLIGLADSLIKEVPEITNCKFHKIGEEAPMDKDLLLFDGVNYAVGTAMHSGEMFEKYGDDLGFDEESVKKWLVINKLEELQ
nr:MAG TPA: hypothetical protein [Caudoviricetes sp.]